MNSNRLYEMSPEELTQAMLHALTYHYETALTATIAERNRHLRQARELLAKLYQGLHDGGGIISAQLEEVYLYMAKGSLEALIEQDLGKIEELHALATDLEMTWDEAIEKARLQPAHVGGNRYENYQ
ncbi:flagellar protein FliS [Exiguobacterium sp. SH3S2]|uniref:flagellar export chaperone FliS n=1 Tax=unclassified Exiguobacterium TaxID=2644629 RepID=UPI00103F9B6D|nr:MULTISPECIES: flagellar protein FliS [unclassified Exiguobacterium]TCI48995.1 flagellar protein FliS [Exiguobacterium sp. SH3S3]TCI63859.1 flagellar protein FliS [Exiguobacterium sp. SH3S2]